MRIRSGKLNFQLADSAMLWDLRDRSFRWFGHNPSAKRPPARAAFFMRGSSARWIAGITSQKFRFVPVAEDSGRFIPREKSALISGACVENA
jgi:hypothetical protein